MMNFSLELFNAAPVKDARGTITKSFTSVGFLDGVFLPIGGEQAQREYGVTVPVDFQFFTKEEHDNLKVGNRLKHQGTYYEIVYIADYVKIRSALCKAVQ